MDLIFQVQAPVVLPGFSALSLALEKSSMRDESVLHLDDDFAGSGGTRQAGGVSGKVDGHVVVLGEFGVQCTLVDSESATNDGVGARKIGEGVKVVDFSGGRDFLGSGSAAADCSDREAMLLAPITEGPLPGPRRGPVGRSRCLECDSGRSRAGRSIFIGRCFGSAGCEEQ